MYSSSLCDFQWQLVSSFFEKLEKRGRKSRYSKREILDAILYLLENGTKWRNLPKEFPNWKTVYYYFRKWSLSGLFNIVNRELNKMYRKSIGREETPSMGSIDSQSQAAAAGVSDRGIDGGKKVNGRKKTIFVDTLGLLWICLAAPANTSDKRLGNTLMPMLNNPELFPRLKKALVDSTFKNCGEKYPLEISHEGAERREGQKGFIPEAFRWAVERTFSWQNNNRRLTRVFEKQCYHQETMCYIANTRLVLNRLVN